MLWEPWRFCALFNRRLAASGAEDPRAGRAPDQPDVPSDGDVNGYNPCEDQSDDEDDP